MIKENIKLVENIISGRAKLIAVSKTKPVEDLMEAYDAGIRDFGENKVQELVMKYDAMPKDIRWHMIGHLQTNKVKQLIGKVYMIHSIDTMKLADKINSESEKAGVITEGLLEVNIANEESKYGFTEITDEDLKHLSELKNLRIRGLMTVAPNVSDPELNRPVFKQLKALSVDIEAKNIDNINMDILSMGMTNDYMVALEEGSAYVRVGTGIFGRRIYTETEK